MRSEMRDLGIYRMPKRLGRTELRIMDYLLNHWGACHTWELQQAIARTHAGYTKVVSRALDRLHKRGIVKREYDPLTHGEAVLLDIGRQRRPRASAFWIVAQRHFQEPESW
jgi:DNA-binding HxlR family transcriptional regulator